VRPNAYLAFGVKGAVQHIVGMMGSKYVFGAPRPPAPIVNYADDVLGADLFDVLPRILAEVRAWKAKQKGQPRPRPLPKAAAAAKG